MVENEILLSPTGGNYAVIFSHSVCADRLFVMC